MPVAHEDDAVRAVRAGLDLVAAVTAMGEQVGVPDLAMRVGIVTGEVAVTLGAVGEGMVAGDAVNTAARVQAAAEPGQVWVDEATRSLSAAAVSYGEGAEHVLKGKAEPVRLFPVRTIVAVAAGTRVDGLEAPFTGRDRELRLVKELFHSVVEDGRARHVAVWGVAGVGKSRLGWELDKYIDGIDAVTWWHRGRALSYGDGVAFWALAEMVRSRLGIAEGDPAPVQHQRLSAALADLVADPGERDRLAPRLAVLLGLELGAENATFPREDLFAAWTALFEHLAANGQCVVLLFEDMQHADSGLLDFVDHLLESARFPLFVVTFSRPELAEARPQFGTGRRSTPVYLEPLGDAAMARLVDGLVDGLPAQARDSLTARAEGIPLYAVETVRALIDRDAVIPRDGRYVLADGSASDAGLADLGAPTSLQALISARLDALTSDERRVVGDASVHGMTFSREALAGTTTVDDLDGVLAALVRKEIIALHTDAFSPERGQYRFVQSLVRAVAYDTLSRRDRKARHLAVAALIAAEDQGDELTGVLARHYLDALDAGPGDPDADELRLTALGLLEKAAARARSLGSTEEALRHYLLALERDPDPETEARLREGAARSAGAGPRGDEALEHAARAREVFESLGRTVDAARTVAVHGDILIGSGRVQEAVEVMSPVYEALKDDETAHAGVADLASELARASSYLGAFPEAERYTKRALQAAEARSDWPQVVNLLMRYGSVWMSLGIPTGGLALLHRAVDLARAHHLQHELIRPLANTSNYHNSRDLAVALDAGREALALTTRLGRREETGTVLANLLLGLWFSGGWDEVVALGRDVAQPGQLSEDLIRLVMVLVAEARGTEIDDDLVPALDLEAIDDLQARAAGEQLLALARSRQGQYREAAAQAARSVHSIVEAAGMDDDFACHWPLSVEHALAAGDRGRARALLQMVVQAPAGLVSPLAHAQLLRLRGMIAVADGQADGADADLARAVDELRAFGAPFYLARTLLSLAELRADTGVPITDLLDEARTIFTSLGARPWVEAVDRVATAVPA